MNKPEFKKGDHVKIKSEEHFYGEFEFNEIQQYFDRCAIIIDVKLKITGNITKKVLSSYKYHIDIDYGRWWWFENDIVNIKKIRKQKSIKLFKI